MKQNFDPVDPFDPPTQYTVPSQLHKPGTRMVTALWSLIAFVSKAWNSFCLKIKGFLGFKLNIEYPVVRPGCVPISLTVATVHLEIEFYKLVQIHKVPEGSSKSIRANRYTDRYSLSPLK